MHTPRRCQEPAVVICGRDRAAGPKAVDVYAFEECYNGQPAWNRAREGRLGLKMLENKRGGVGLGKKFTDMLLYPIRCAWKINVKGEEKMQLGGNSRNPGK